MPDNPSPRPRMTPGAIAELLDTREFCGCSYPQCVVCQRRKDAATSLWALEVALTEALPVIDELAARCASGPASVYLSDARLMPLVAIRDAVVSRCADCGERIDHGAWVCECHGTHRCKACDTQHLLSPTTSPTGEET